MISWWRYYHRNDAIRTVHTTNVSLHTSIAYRRVNKRSRDNPFRHLVTRTTHPETTQRITSDAKRTFKVLWSFSGTSGLYSRRSKTQQAHKR